MTDYMNFLLELVVIYGGGSFLALSCFYLYKNYKNKDDGIQELYYYDKERKKIIKLEYPKEQKKIKSFVGTYNVENFFGNVTKNNKSDKNRQAIYLNICNRYFSNLKCMNYPNNLIKKEIVDYLDELEFFISSKYEYDDEIFRSELVEVDIKHELIYKILNKIEIISEMVSLEKKAEEKIIFEIKKSKNHLKYLNIYFDYLYYDKKIKLEKPYLNILTENEFISLNKVRDNFVNHKSKKLIYTVETEHNKNKIINKIDELIIILKTEKISKETYNEYISIISKDIKEYHGKLLNIKKMRDEIDNEKLML